MKLGLFRLGRFRWSIALGFVAFLGAAHILIRTSMYRVDYHTDPEGYIIDARALATGKIFVEGLLQQFPPFYAAVLSLYRLFDVEISDMGRYVNTVCLGLIILVANHWLYRFAEVRLVVIGVAVTIAVSYPLVRASSQLLSETLFILIMLLSLINIKIFMSNRKSKVGLGLSIIFSALAFLTRYIGITVIFTGALLILVCRGPPPRIRWKQAAFYSAVSSLPTALWMARNQIVMGSLTARQNFCVTNQSFGDTVAQFGDQLHLWIFVRQDFGWLDICLWVAVALIWFEWLKTLTVRSMSERKGTLFQKIGSSLDIKEQPALPFAAFAIVYLVVLFVVAPYTTCEPPTAARYLLPIYVPTAITAAVWLERFLLKTYQNSGISVWKNSDGCGISYLKTSGSMATTRWIIISLILTVILVSVIRNIALYIDILTTYSPRGYQF